MMDSAPENERAAHSSAASAQPTPDGPRQFDFWLGEWDVTWEGGAGTNSIARILDNQVIQERFTAFASGPDDQPLHGMSLSVYVPALENWRQTWVDNTGAYMDFTGGFGDGRMTLSTGQTVDGKPITQRMTFFDISEAALDWDWERSADGGESWTRLWRIHYRRRA